MFEYITAAILALILWFVYRFYIKPQKLIAFYCRELESKGFRVYRMPFKFMSMPFYEMLYNDSINHQDSFYSLKQMENNFDFVVTNMLSTAYVTTCNYQFIKKIYGPEYHYDFPKDSAAFSLIGKYFGQGLILTQGQHWKKKKKILSKILNFDFIKLMVPQITKICNQAFDKIDQKFTNSQQNSQKKTMKIDLRPVGLNLFNTILVSKFLGRDFMEKKNNKQEQFYKLIYQLVRMAGQLSLNDKYVNIFGPSIIKTRIKKQYREIYDLNRVIKSHVQNYIIKKQKQFSTKTQNEKSSSYTILQSFFYYSEKQNVKFSPRQLCNQVEAFVIAGVDNVNSVFMSMLFLTFEHQQVLQKLKKQINELIKTDEDITYDNLKKLVYIDFIQNQTFRLFSSTGFSFDRIATKDVLINGIPIKKDTIVNYFSKGIGFNQKYFPNPHKFIPQRWQNNEFSYEMQSAIGLQFGFGPRQCIGKQFTSIEYKIALIKFIKRYSNLKELHPRRFKVDTVAYFENTQIELQKE